jgi:hypothetical protein
VTYWLLVRGRGERPLPRLLVADEITAHRSSRRPSVQRGDLAVLYASVWQALFGVVEVVGDPEHDPYPAPAPAKPAAPPLGSAPAPAKPPPPLSGPAPASLRRPGGSVEPTPPLDRWSWRFEIRPLVAIEDLELAPPVEAAGIFPQSVWRHSYIRLDAARFEAARKLVEAAATHR